MGAKNCLDKTGLGFEKIHAPKSYLTQIQFGASFELLQGRF